MAVIGRLAGMAMHHARAAGRDVSSPPGLDS
jgi:hypothetical protein